MSAAASLQRIADSLERESERAGHRGRVETAEALATFRVVVLEEIAELEERGGIRARLRERLTDGAGELP